MALDKKRLQQKRAKKAAKRKALAVGKKTQGMPRGLVSGARSIALATTSPIHECLIPQELFEGGMGTVVVSRALPDGQIGASFFLLDVFCLGVKNAYFLAMPREEYSYRLETLRFNETLIPIEPSYARKVVEETEAYARDLGFSPHPDYQVAKKIFADIDAMACTTRFPFGKDGKPFFIAGPNDTPKRVQKILDTLTKRCGPDGFHYMVGVGGARDFGEEEIGVEAHVGSEVKPDWKSRLIKRFRIPFISKAT
jgi:hypothetical protein